MCHFKQESTLVGLLYAFSYLKIKNSEFWILKSDFFYFHTHIRFYIFFLPKKFLLATPEICNQLSVTFRKFAYNFCKNV